MGRFKQQRPIYKLIFAEPEFDGLEIRIRSLPIGELEELSAMKARDMTDEQEADELNNMLRRFSGALVEWNIDDDNDNPVPTTLAGVRTQDTQFLLRVIKVWIETISGVHDADPLGSSSTSGGPSLEESIPMETLSRSRAS